MITLFSIISTVIVYCLIRLLAGKFPSPLTSPVFLCTFIIILILLACHVSYQEYTPARNIMTYFLGPATVALAVPIYRNRSLMAKYIAPAIAGILFGTITTIATAMILAKWFHFSKTIILSFSIKSVTVPVATEIGRILGGNLSLIAAFVIVTGMIGAMFGARLLSFFKVEHPFARGLSIGTISHGIGTAEAVKEGEIQGAVAGAAMGISALLTSFILPYVIHYFL